MQTAASMAVPKNRIFGVPAPLLAAPKQPAMPGLVATGLPAPAPTVPSQALVNAAAARIAALDAAIEADPSDVGAWDGRLREAVQSGKPQEVFERAVRQFPYAARIWMTYAEWSEVQGIAQAQAVYQRCLQQVPSLDLWQQYLGFCKRSFALEEVIKAYQRAVALLGTDNRAGTLWVEYLTLLKRCYNVQQKKDNPDAEVSGKLLAEDANPVEAARRTLKAIFKKRLEDNPKAADLSDEEFLRVGEALKLDIPMLRTTFQTAASTAHSSLDKLWIGYEQFEKSQGNPQLAQKILGEHMPRFVRGKAAYKELQALCNGLEYTAVAAPLTQKNCAQQGKLIEKWRGVLQYERGNPLQLPKPDVQARVALLYQQAALGCAHHAELWHDFADWLDMGGQRDEATKVLRNAVERFLPKDLTLRLLLAHRHELSEVPASPSSIEAADEEYRKLLEDMPKPCPLALINFLAFVRRQRGAGEFRSAFIEATESSPHCTWEVYLFAALTEYHVFGSLDAATKTFQVGLERYGEREPALLAAYVNFLVGANDLRGARKELSSGVLERLQAGVRDRMSSRSDARVQESLSFLWQKWARLERYFGDAEAVRRCTAFRDEEYRNLQRDQEVDEEAVSQSPASLGLALTITEIEEAFRFQHLVPEASRLPQQEPQQQPQQQLQVKAPGTLTPGPVPKAPVQADSPTAARPQQQAAASAPILDTAVSEAVDEQRRLGSAVPTSGLNVHIVRPDVSKMLAFRPALDVVGLKKPTGPDGVEISHPRPMEEEKTILPTMIPKCLQDLLAVLPARPLKGAKPDVDYLLTVLQTVHIPPIPVQDLERFRYDSLRLLKEEDNTLLRRRGLIKDDLDDGPNGFFSAKPTLYRERLQAKRQKVMEEQGIKSEGL